MKIAKDKWKHFYVGILMGGVLQWFFRSFLHVRFGLSILFAIILSIIIAYGFELFSKITGKGHYEVMDAVAAVIGAVLGIGTVLLLQLF